MSLLFQINVFTKQKQPRRLTTFLWLMYLKWNYMKQWIKFCIQCNLVSNAENLISYVVIWLKNSQEKFYFWSTMGKIISFVFNLIRYTHQLQVHWLGNLQFFLNVKHATNLASSTLFLQELGKQYFVKVPKIKRQTKLIVKKNILPNLSDWLNFN